MPWRSFISSVATAAAGLVVAVLLANAAAGQGYPPEQAAAKMTTAAGLQVTLFASEPQVRQPILVKVDDRGRLWTIQYLQYPNPAGLERVAVDRWSRTVYDRVPRPPPHGPRGADRITILEDTDGDGRADRFKDFVDGLNLATGLALGHGGVYVLQVPYLLFYPDRDRDDVPDGDPTVLLKGFGMEDAQSLANHLTWGPDGWLYGVNGSTTTCRIRGIEFQQGVWRYHPTSDTFELFCEGGGNTFGLTFDERGNLFYSTNGGPFIHALQGAYYRKSFGKHGPLHNLYAYGFFEVVQRDQVPGGPPTGGTVYLGHRFPAPLRGTFIAGNFLGHTASWWDVAPLGSTFTAKYGGLLLDSHDTWFGPTDMCLGPDGAMYICDFHDQRTAHPDPDANWDRSNGRIYRITGQGTEPYAGPDLRTLASAELVDLLAHPNAWLADRARVQLAARRDASVQGRLREMANDGDESLALRALWALHVSGGYQQPTALAILKHPSPAVRMWGVRLLGDAQAVAPPLARALAQLAAEEASPVVRCQLAATARRLPPAAALPIIAALLEQNPHEKDLRVPWMIWWAIEENAIRARDQLVELLAAADCWNSPLGRQQARLLLRRWAAEGRSAEFEAIAAVLPGVPAGQRQAVFAAVARGLAERADRLGTIGQGGLFEQFAERTPHDEPPLQRPVEQVQGKLRDAVLAYWREDAHDTARLRLALLCEAGVAKRYLLELIAGERAAGNVSAARLNLLFEFGDRDCLPVVLDCLESARDESARDEAALVAAIRVLGRFPGQRVTESLLGVYAKLTAGPRAAVIDVLVRRPDSAAALLEQVDAGRIDSRDIDTAQLRAVAVHQDAGLDQLVHKHWGRITPGTPEEKLATMRRFSNDLRAGSGHAAAGKALFAKHCGVCHQLFGEGNKVGPDLTTANRQDQAALLAEVVDPSAVVRRDYLSFVVTTNDGRLLTGLLAEQDAASVTLLDEKNRRLRLRRAEIESIRQAQASLMPERLLDPLSPQQLRDLFAYLRQ